MSAKKPTSLDDLACCALPAPIVHYVLSGSVTQTVLPLCLSSQASEVIFKSYLIQPDLLHKSSSWGPRNWMSQ